MFISKRKYDNLVSDAKKGELFESEYYRLRDAIIAENSNKLHNYYHYASIVKDDLSEIKNNKLKEFIKVSYLRIFKINPKRNFDKLIRLTDNDKPKIVENVAYLLEISKELDDYLTKNGLTIRKK